MNKFDNTQTTGSLPEELYEEFIGRAKDYYAVDPENEKETEDFVSTLSPSLTKLFELTGFAIYDFPKCIFSAIEKIIDPREQYDIYGNIDKNPKDFSFYQSHIERVRKCLVGLVYAEMRYPLILQGVKFELPDKILLSEREYKRLVDQVREKRDCQERDDLLFDLFCEIGNLMVSLFNSGDISVGSKYIDMIVDIVAKGYHGRHIKITKVSSDFSISEFGMTRSDNPIHYELARPINRTLALTRKEVRDKFFSLYENLFSISTN